MDKLVEGFVGITPYQYSFNNPLIFNDPTGLFPEDPLTRAIENLNRVYDEGVRKGRGWSEAGNDQNEGENNNGTVTQIIQLKIWGESSDISASVLFPVYMKLDKDGNVQKVFFDRETKDAGKVAVSDGYNLETGLVVLDDDDISTVFSIYMTVTSKSEQLDIQISGGLEKGKGSIGASSNLPTVRLSNEETQTFKMTIEIRKDRRETKSGRVVGNVVFSNFPSSLTIVAPWYRGGNKKNYVSLRPYEFPEWFKFKE